MSVNSELWSVGRALMVVGALLVGVSPGTARADLPEAAAAQKAAAAPPRGLLVKVPLPITGNVDRRVVQEVRRAVSEWKGADRPAGDVPRPVLILEFQPGQTEFGLGSEFEDALKLARFLTSPQLDGVKTVAYLPRSIKGHAVLVVAACEQIVMAADAELGEAGADHDADHPMDETIIGGYRQIARSRRTIPVEIALGMLDPQREVLRVETEEGPQLIFAADLEQLRETKTIDDDQTRVIFRAGQPGLLSGREARQLGIAAYLAADRSEVAEHLGLPGNALRVARFTEGELRARLIMLDRPLDSKLAETRVRMMRDAIEGRANFLCLWIDSPGGDVEAATKLAGFLSQLDSDEVLTAAYIPATATGTAALVALACDEVLMHPTALLGGGEPDLSDEERLDVMAAIEDEIVPRKSRSRSLLAAMFAPDLVVHRYQNRRTGVTRYLTEQEWAAQPEPDDWQREIVVCDVGEWLEVDGNEADQLGLAAAVVDNFEDFKQRYGLEDDPQLAEPTWVDDLVRALASPGLAWLLVMIGLAGVYAEVQMPGIGAGAFIAAVAFTLFFWSNFLEGTAGALEVVLFLVGVACLLLEVFVLPGFGIFGLGGGILVLVSLVLASQTFILPVTRGEVRELRDSMLIVGGALVGLLGFATFMRRYLPHTPLLNRIMLPAPEDEVFRQSVQRETLVNYQHLVGRRGVTTTQLTPSGKASLDDQLIDVISEGELVQRDTQVEVVEVHGNRVVVRPVE